MTTYILPDVRLETSLDDKKPLYSRGEAVTEANRCIYCADAPCVEACPTGIDIPTFIHKIATDNVKGSARTILQENLLGYSCARVCPVEVLCAGSCVYNHWGRKPIEIGRLQRYAVTHALSLDPDLVAKKRKPSSGKTIALVGAGPASLAAAGHLALEGHKAVIYERNHVPGGLNTLGIAPYKLKAGDALSEIEFLLGLGDVEIHTGISVVAENPGEHEVSVAHLNDDFDAVFIGIGLGPDSRLDVDGIDGPGVEGATDLIARIKIDGEMSLEGIQRAIVVGGGNTAIDIAHELALLGVSDVAMVYRRTEAKMSGYRHEMASARLDGVRLIENRQPAKVVREGSKVAGLEVKKSDGGGVETLPCDLVVLAIGQARLTELAKAFDGVELDDKGRIAVDEATCRTGNSKVYAGGDCVNGGKEVVNAAQHGKLAARAITEALA